jgi:hypothetical protein
MGVSHVWQRTHLCEDRISSVWVSEGTASTSCAALHSTYLRPAEWVATNYSMIALHELLSTMEVVWDHKHASVDCHGRLGGKVA